MSDGSRLLYGVGVWHPLHDRWRLESAFKASFFLLTTPAPLDEKDHDNGCDEEKYNRDEDSFEEDLEYTHRDSGATEARGRRVGKPN